MACLKRAGIAIPNKEQSLTNALPTSLQQLPRPRNLKMLVREEEKLTHRRSATRTRSPGNKNTRALIKQKESKEDFLSKTGTQAVNDDNCELFASLKGRKHWREVKYGGF